MLQFTLRYTPIAQYVQSVDGVMKYAGFREAADWSNLRIGPVRSVKASSLLALIFAINSNTAIGLPAAFDWRAGHPILSHWFDHVASDPIFTGPLQHLA
jgi:hypothetical protein